jgi:hypothetical protein
MVGTDRMSDLTAVVALAASLASLVTAHVAIVWGLGRRRPRWRAAVAFVVPVLAPAWAARERMWVRAAIWCAAAGVYGVLRVVVR